MYSGSDSNESQKFPQWALNPATYQNMANDQVDWAALAQQWIIMKEAGPPPVPGEHPIVLGPPTKKEVKHEGGESGEAPMEVENDKVENQLWTDITGPPPRASGSGDSWNWNTPNQSWGWNNTWAPPPVPPLTSAAPKPPLLPTPGNFNQYNAPADSANDNATFGGYATSANNEYQAGYWTSNKHIKPHNRRYSKVNAPRPVPPAPPIISESSPPSTLDAVKRKQLPAWIREGLEKMERDKLKQIEREREKQERDDYNEKVKESEKVKMEILKNTMKEQQKSKFESDGEYPDEDIKEKKSILPAEIIPLTPDELMLKVRRLMTEILLNVTTRHIATICKEEHQRYLKKFKGIVHTSDQRVAAPTGANISAKLGLGMYGGGSGSSSEDSDEDSQRDKKDSDTELKEVIKKRVTDFLRTEKEIEDKLAAAESRKAGDNSRASSSDTNDNESQVDVRAQDKRLHHDDKLPTHSKNTFDSKYHRRSSSSDRSDSYPRSRLKSRRSTSSESSDSYIQSNKKYRSRSDSRTPERKYKSRTEKNGSSSKSSSAHSRRSVSISPSKSRRSRSHTRKSSRHSKRSRSRSRSYSRYRRSVSSSYKKIDRSSSRERGRRRSRSSERSTSRSTYSKFRRSRSRSNGRKISKRKRSRSSSSGRGKRSHRH